MTERCYHRFKTLMGVILAACLYLLCSSASAAQLSFSDSLTHYSSTDVIHSGNNTAAVELSHLVTALNLDANISMTGDYAYGAYLAGTYNAMAQSGDINVWGTSSYGAYLYTYGTLTQDGDINVSGDYSRGAYIGNDNTVTRSGDINVSGFGSYGAYLDINNMLTQSGDINVSGDFSSGAYLSSGNTLTQNGDINVSGDNSYGMYLYNGNTLTQSGDINVSGGSSYGAYIDYENTLTQNGDINVSGDNSYGMYLYNDNTLTQSGDINVSGDYLYGAYLNSGNTLTRNGDVNVSGNRSYGAYLYHSSTLTQSGDINVWGTSSYGAYLYTYGTLTQSGDINVSGDYSRGAYLDNNNTLTQNGDINVSGFGSSGAYLSSGNTLTQSGDINVSGDYSRGVHLFNDNTLTRSGDINVSGFGSYGANLDINNMLTQTGDINVSGDYSSGVNLGNDNTVTRNGDINVSGDYSSGAYLSSGNTLTQSGDINVSGDSSYGAYIDYENTLTQNGDINVSGDYSSGAYLSSGNTLTQSGDINVSGDYSYGAYLNSGNTLTRSGDINVSGDDSYGAHLYNGNALTQNGGINVSGDYSYGAYLYFSNTLTQDGDINVSGDYSYGAYLSNDNTLTQTGKIGVLGDNSTGVFSGFASVALITDGVVYVIGDSSHALEVSSNGSIVLDNTAVSADGVDAAVVYAQSEGGSIEAGNSSFLLGNIINSSDMITDTVLYIELSGASSLTGSVTDVNSSSLTSLTLSGGGDVWNVSGNSTLNGELSNSGVIDYSGAALGTEVRVNDLSGGGGFIMKADIVSQIGDSLVVDGTSVGSYTITVANQGSAAVTGSELVTLVETADTGSSFALTNAVEWGAWQYALRSQADGSGQYWELYRSGTVTSGGFSNTASAAINTFVASYLLNYAEINTLIQRLGDLRDTSRNDGSWFRAYGGRFKDFERSYVRNFDMDYGGVQIGYDHKLENNRFGNGDTYVGAFIGYSKGDLDYTYTGGGSGGVENRSMGMYAVYIGKSGFYVDAVAKYTWSRLDFDVLDSAGTLVHGKKINSGGMGLSLETGKRFRFGHEGKNKGGWYVEPQVQLSWQRMSGGTFTASNGLVIGLGSYESLLGRAGIMLGYETDRTNIYAKVSYVKEFDGDMDIHANGSSIYESMSDNWLVYGLGVTHRVNDRNAFYLELERSSGGYFTHDWAIYGGWRISF